MTHHEEWIAEMTEVMNGSWESEGQKINNAVNDALRNVDRLQEYIRNETDVQKRDLLIMKCKEEQDRLNIAISNLGNMEGMMGMVINFLGSIKGQLGALENRLISIGEDIAEIKKDVKYLKGKNISELYEYQYNQVMSSQLFDKVWIPIRAKMYAERSNTQTGGFNAFDRLTEFIKNKEASTLLISGQSGQGKTTLLKHYQKKLFTLWRKKENILCEVFRDLEPEQMQIIKSNLEELEFPAEVAAMFNNLKEGETSYKSKLFFLSEANEVAKKMAKVPQTTEFAEKIYLGEGEARILPVWINLPSCPDPLQNLIQHTLKKTYGFDMRRIQQLKDKVRAEKPKYKILFIMMGYDEMKEEYLYKNLYSSND